MGFFDDQLADIEEIYESIKTGLEKEKDELSGKVQCTVDAIERALGGKSNSDFGSSYGYGYSSGYGRQRKAMVGYRTPRRRRRY